MLKIAMTITHGKEPDREFGLSGKEALAYALTAFFNSKGLMVIEHKIREIKTHVRAEKSKDAQKV